LENEAHSKIQPELSNQVKAQSQLPKRYVIDAPTQAYPATNYVEEGSVDYLKEISEQLLFRGQDKLGPAAKAYEKKLKEQNYQTGGNIKDLLAADRAGKVYSPSNIQKLGDIEFDSNKTR
jgi:hypothetical protein